MSASTISSLALLKTRYDTAHVDFLDTLRPFISYIVGKDALKEFPAAEIKTGLLDEFGLDVPRHTVDLLLRRLAKGGQLKREDKKYFVVKLENNVAEFEAHRADAVRHQNAAVDSLISYAATTLDLILTSEAALEALYSYVDQYSIDCIQAYSSGSIVPVHGKSLKNWHYVVSSFVNQLSTNNPEQFRYLVTVVMGRMLSNALLGEDLNDVAKRFKDTTVFLDTPILLQILGVLGEAPRLLAEEMLLLLGSANASVAAFEHNISEVDTILRKAERSLDNAAIAGRGDVYLNLRELKYSSSDVAILRSSIADRLQDKAITIHPTPRYINELQIDEVALEQEMTDAGLLYRAQAAMRCDVNSIRSIYVLRHKRTPRKVEDCGAVFVTNNTALARAAFAYGRRHEESTTISTVIADFSLTNLLWLKAPMKYQDIPERMMAVSCYAALRPSSSFWAAFLEQVDKLSRDGKVTSSQLQFLRYEMKVRDALMHLTFGDEDSVGEQQILVLLDRHEHELTEPLHEKIRGLQGAVDTATAERDEASTQLRGVEDRIEAFARVVRQVLIGILVLIALTLLAFAHGWINPSITADLGPVAKWSLRIGVYMADAFVLAHAVFHVTILNPVSWVARAIERRMVLAFRKLLGLRNDVVTDEVMRPEAKGIN